MGAISVKKNVRQHSCEIDNIEELKEIAIRYAKVKDYVFSRYSGINSLPILNKYKSEIRDKWTDKAAKKFNEANPNGPQKAGFAKQWKLPSRYWKLALDEAISNIKAEWSNIKNRVKEAVMKNENLTQDEKAFMCYILKTESIFNSIILRKGYVRPKSVAKLEIREKYVHNLIRRYVRKYKGAIPFSKKKRSFEIDANLYEYKLTDKGLFIEISGLTPRKRISIKLRDNKIHKGNLRVVVVDDSRVEINRCKDVKVNVRYDADTETILAIDKGYTSLFATNTDKEYGVNLGTMLTTETERLFEYNKKRTAIWQLIDKYEKAQNFEKAERIRRNNFGRIKYNRLKNKFDERTKSYINHSIYEMLDKENPSIIVLESLTFQSWYKKLTKGVKRKLSRWTKGYIQERLEYIASTRGIKVVNINPAYTSQICYKCGSFGKRNEKKFECQNCGVIDADINAAHNIEHRYLDSEITLYTPYVKVKEILLKRQNQKQLVI